MIFQVFFVFNVTQSASVESMLLILLCGCQVKHSLYDGTVFLNGNHMRKLKEEFGENISNSFF